MNTRSILKQDKIFSQNEIKEMLKITRSKAMSDVLLKVLDQDITSFSYDEDYKYLLNIFTYLNKFLDENDKNLPSYTITKLELIHKKLHNLLLTKPGDISKNDERYQLLKKLTLLLEEFCLQLSYYETDELLDRLYPYISTFIFEFKNLVYVDSIFYRFPNVVNYKNKDGVFLFEEVVNKYLESLDKNDRSLILYYDSIIELFFKSKHFHILSIDREKLKKEIYNRIHSLDSKSFSYKDKVFFLDSLKRTLTDNRGSLSNFDNLCVKYQIPISFDKFLLDELSLYDMDILENKNRRIIDSSFIMAIDGENAKEVDDSLSIKKLDNGNYLVGVHISNVTGYIPYSSLTIDEARRRTTSIYLSDRTISMFPSVASKEKWSQKVGTPRLTHSYYFEITPFGSVLDYRFYKSITTLSYQATYDEVNEILKHGSTNKELEKTCFLLEEVASSLEKKFNVPKWYKHIEFDDISNSEKIVTNLMLLTNKTVAEHFYNMKYPLIRRVHQLDDVDKIKIEKMINEVPLENGINSNLRKTLENILSFYPSAVYQKTGRHDGLDFDHYCHATSPLRRFPDILVEQCLDLCYFQNPTDEDIYFLEEEIDQISKITKEKSKNIKIFTKRYEEKKLTNL